jgi:hypothetical protein
MKTETDQGAAEQMAATMAGNKKYDLATDVLVDILLRLPPSSRRRARLVCRHWRAAVDDRTPEMQSRAVRTLISVWNTFTLSGSGYVVDDLSGGRSRKRYGKVDVIGTCNGLICMCNDEKPGGAVTLANPVTGEELVVPSLPSHNSSGQGHRLLRHRWECDLAGTRRTDSGTSSGLAGTRRTASATTR